MVFAVIIVLLANKRIIVMPAGNEEGDLRAATRTSTEVRQNGKFGKFRVFGAEAHAYPIPIYRQLRVLSKFELMQVRRNFIGKGRCSCGKNHAQEKRGVSQIHVGSPDFHRFPGLGRSAQNRSRKSIWLFTFAQSDEIDFASVCSAGLGS